MTPTDITQTSDTGTWTFQQCQTVNGLYKVYVTKGGAIGTSASADVVMTVTVDATTTLYAPDDIGGTTPLASLETTAFQRAQPNNTWVLVCIIRNSTPNPTVTFTHTGGTVSAEANNRLYCDAARFQLVDPCADVTPQVAVTGPLAAGQTFVNVGVSQGATNVTVYANAVQIGLTNYAAGFEGGTVQVLTRALVKGEPVTATQIKLNPQGFPCPGSPGSPAIVGGGPNATLTFFASCYKTPELTGPVGSDGAAVGFAYYMPCTTVTYGQPPVGGITNVPTTCWQTITVQHGVDAAREYNGGSLGDFSTDAYCSLDGLVINQVDPDTGPYEIYVDQIMNGTNIVEDFESYATDSVSTFAAPGATTPAIPDPNITYLPPNSSTISTAHAYDGTKSCRISWQWTTAGGRYARVQASGASGGKKWPQLDTTKPISFKILVLPVGATTGSKFNGSVGPITNTTPVYDGGSVTLGVTVTGTGSYTYQWLADGAEVGGATERTYTDPVLPWDDNGVQVTRTYNVKVSDGNCTLSAVPVTLAPLLPVPIITNQPVSKVVHVGTPASICVGATNAPSGGDTIFNYTWEKVDDTGTNWWAVGGGGTATCLSDVFPAAQFTEIGHYRVVIQGSYGSVTSSVASLQVVSADVVIGTGVGLRGNYFNLPTWTGEFVAPAWAGTPTVDRVDPTVAFDWVTDSPDPAVTVDDFAVRWYGQIQPLYSDTYTFTVRSDDGARLWIDKQLVVDYWHPQGATDRTGTITLNTSKHDILLEYFERGGNASVMLYWTNSGGQIFKTLVPVQQLYANQATWVPPAVALTAPTDGSIVTLPAQVSLAANVVTNDGIVKAVEFYNGSTLITTVTNPPYSASWTAVVGSHPVSAKVVYNESSREVSATNTVTVNAITKAPVTIDSIVNNGNGTVIINYSGGAGASFTLMKSAVVPNPTRDSWTSVGADNPGTPGSFTTTPAGNEFYTIRSN